jgi:Sec-independent protein translocase protein TatA
MRLPGIWELVIIALILIVIFGGSKAMTGMKGLGRELYGIKKKLDDLDNIKKGKF